eukprot:5409750-Prymnesium_polylepis.1
MPHHPCNLCGITCKQNFTYIATSFRDADRPGTMPPPHVLRFALGREAACPKSPVLHTRSQQRSQPSCYRQALDAWAVAGDANAQETIGARRARERRGEELPAAAAKHRRAKRETEVEVLTQTGGQAPMSVNDFLAMTGGQFETTLVDTEAAANEALLTPRGKRELDPAFETVDLTEANLGTVAALALLDAGMSESLANENAAAMAPQLVASEARVRREEARRTEDAGGG